MALPSIVVLGRRIVDLGKIWVARLRRASGTSLLHVLLVAILPLLFSLLVQASCGTLPCLM